MLPAAPLKTLKLPFPCTILFSVCLHCEFPPSSLRLTFPLLFSVHWKWTFEKPVITSGLGNNTAQTYKWQDGESGGNIRAQRTKVQTQKKTEKPGESCFLPDELLRRSPSQADDRPPWLHSNPSSHCIPSPSALLLPPPSAPPHGPLQGFCLLPDAP